MANICDTIQKIDNNLSGLITHQDHIIKKSYFNSLLDNLWKFIINMTLMSKYAAIICLYSIKIIRDCILSCPFIIDKRIAYACIAES